MNRSKVNIIIIVDYHSVFGNTFVGQCHKFVRVSYVILHAAKWISINILRLVVGNYIENSKVTF